jgi:tellurite resistance protein
VRFTHESSANFALDPFDWHQQAVNALLISSALVALADGRVDRIERDVAIDYIDQHQLAAAMSRRQIAAKFDQSVRCLEDRDFVDLVIDAFRPVPALSLASDVLRIAELVAAADGQVLPIERGAVALIRLITTKLPAPKTIERCSLS